MPFMLRDVGLECFTLVFRGEDIGSVFAIDDDHAQPWIASLHEHRFRAGSELPAPFTSNSHRFASLHELQDWLGISTHTKPEVTA